MIEIFLSSDGKNTVKVEAKESDVEGAYKTARLIFNQMLKDYPGTKMEKDMKRVKEEANLGDCPNCGAPMKLSAKGKPYCSAKCWL